MADGATAAELKTQLEATLLLDATFDEDDVASSSSSSSSSSSALDDWALAVDFCRIYALPLPLRMLNECAARNRWLTFVIFVQRFDYPPQVFLPVLKEFVNPCLGDHLELALLLDHESAEKHLCGLEVDMESIRTVPATDFYSLLLQGTSLSSNSSSSSSSSSDASAGRENVLDFACRMRSVEMTVIAAVLDPAARFACLCAYIHLNLEPESPPSAWNREKLSDLLHSALSLRQPDLVLSAFRIFLADHLLTHLLNWLDAFGRHEADTGGLEALRDVHSEIPEFFGQRSHVLRMAIQLLSWWMSYVVDDVEQQMDLVAMWADVLPLEALVDHSDAPEESRRLPDFALISSILSVASSCVMELQVAQLLGDPSALRSECQRLVDVLLARNEFDWALQLASLASLPCDSIFITQLDWQFHRLRAADPAELATIRADFWAASDQLLSRQRVRADSACRFYQDALCKTRSHWESFTLLSYALRWMKRIDPLPLESLAELETLQWKHRIEAELDGAVSDDVQCSVGCPLLSRCLRKRLGTHNYAAVLLDGCEEGFRAAVLRWIHRALDADDIVQATKLSMMFGVESRDLLLLRLLIDLVEDVLPLDQLQQRLKELVGKEEQVKESMIDAVDWALAHGRGLCQRICVYHDVSKTLDLQYDYVADHQHPISVLKMLVETRSHQQPSVGANLGLARSWIAVSAIAAGDVVLLVKEELIDAARAAHQHVDTTESSMVISLLRAQFNRLVTLCSDATQLGTALLDAALEAWQADEWSMAVELLIFAHSSFTLACHVENIGQILTESRCFIERLVVHHQWILITRLLTGIQRYSEMNYVFQLLKEKDQFEYLLRKGMDRLPLLRTALLDFIRRHCSENRELFRMVALHFHMHAEMAAMWQQEAQSMLEPIIQDAAAAASASAASSLSSAPEKSLSLEGSWSSTTAPPSLPQLKVVPELKAALTSAMHSMVHSAEYYLQAGKCNHANKCSLQSELIALQIFLVGRQSGVNGRVHCLLGVDDVTVNHLIVHHLSYPEAEIVCRAYDTPVNWGQALTRHYIVGGHHIYLEEFLRQRSITVDVVEEAVASLDVAAASAEQLTRLERLVALLGDVDVKYRVASRLGLRQLVAQLLSSPALHFLKDTAWKSNNSY